MRNVAHPHTVIAFTHKGQPQTLVRPGHLPARSSNGASVEGVLQSKGVTGAVTVRHHDGAMFGKAGKLVGVFTHEVK